MANGEWRMANGEWRMANFCRLLPTVYCLPFYLNLMYKESEYGLYHKLVLDKNKYGYIIYLGF